MLERLLDPPTLLALAALVTAVAKLISALRKRFPPRAGDL